MVYARRVASAKTEVGDDGYDDFGMKKKVGVQFLVKHSSCIMNVTGIDVGF